MKLTDEQLKEMLVGMPRVREALCVYASVHDKTIDELLDELVVRLHNTNIKKTRRKVEEELRHNPVLTYVVGAQTGIIKDPVIR
jgi:hypothetical protein